MACLPWLIRTRFWVPPKFLRWLKKTDISGNFLILSPNCMLSVLIRIDEAIQMSTPNIQLLCRKSKRFPWSTATAFWPGAMINPQWLELPMSRINVHGPRVVRAIEVGLYLLIHWLPYHSSAHRFIEECKFQILLFCWIYYSILLV